MTTDSKIAFASLFASIVGFLICLPSVIPTSSTIQYINALPVHPGEYTVRYNSHCAARLTVAAKGTNSREYILRTKLTLNEKEIALDAKATFHFTAQHIVSGADYQVTARGVQLEGSYQQKPERLLIVGGTFFGEHLSISTALQSDLLSTPSALSTVAISGPLARAPLGQALQTTAIKHLHSVYFTRGQEVCKQAIDIGPLLQQIQDIQAMSSTDILNGRRPMVRRKKT